MICRPALLLALLAQELSKPRLRNGKVFRAQSHPNFFIVAEGARIIAAGFMTHEVLHLGFLPRFVRDFVRVVFHRFVSVVW